jgi:hypothetical protein
VGRPLPWTPGLVIQTLALQSSIFVLDALTLGSVFRALGESVPFVTVFASFIMASVIATIGFVPLGLGTFEASSVAMLGVLGADVEPALAATLLLRGLTFWLPMLPGLWLARREMQATRSEATGDRDADRSDASTR